MKKLVFLLLSFICFQQAFSHARINEYDYSIIFSGSFSNDVISLRINNHTILKNYKLDNTDPSIQGNLSLTQNNKELVIFYNGTQLGKSKIGVNFILDISITINGKVNDFKVDLRKGKIILVACPQETKDPNIICLEQIQEEFIMMEGNEG